MFVPICLDFVTIIRFGGCQVNIASKPKIILFKPSSFGKGDFFYFFQHGSKTGLMWFWLMYNYSTNEISLFVSKPMPYFQWAVWFTTKQYKLKYYCIFKKLNIMLSILSPYFDCTLSPIRLQRKILSSIVTTFYSL